MTKKQEIIAAKLRESGIGFTEHDGDCYQGNSGDFEEYVYGITVADDETWEKAVVTLGGDLDEAIDKLGDPDEGDGWCGWHVVEEEGFPIDVRTVCVPCGRGEDDEEATEDTFSVVP